MNFADVLPSLYLILFHQIGKLSAVLDLGTNVHVQ